MTNAAVSRSSRPFDRKRFDALRRALVGRLMGRIYRSIEATFRRNGELSLAGIHRIVVCRPNHRLGNMLLLTPLIVELARIFPEAKVDVLVGGATGKEAFCAFPNVASVICLPRHMARHPLAVVRTLLRLRRERYDLAIDPCAASQSGRLLLAAARARHAIGVPLAKPGAAAAAVRRDTNTPTHMAQLPVFLLRNAVSPTGLESIVEYMEYPRLALGLSDSERQVALATLDAMTHGGGPSRPRATIGIFASATGSKRHDPAWWLRFMAEIRAQQTDYAIVELGSEHGQAQLATELASFSSKRIREVAAFISNLTCFISADCGVMHLAAASGVMTIGLFSTSDPAVYAPYGGGSRAIVTTGRNPQDVARDVVGAVEEKISHDVIRTSLAAGAQRRLPAAATP